MNYTQKKRILILPLSMLLCLIFLISACASEPNSYQGGGDSTPTATAYPASGGSTPTATAAPSSGYVVAIASVNVKGVTKKVLTNAQGYTLYYFTPDTSTTSACTAGNGCASNWPPLLSTGSGTPTSNGTLPGTLSVHSNANGNQVLYQNHYLYTFAGDTAPGQANGEGIGGKWFVATPDLK